jgi:hypothetical protein
MPVLTKDQLTLILVIASGCLILTVLWVAALRFTSDQEENFRAAISQDLADAKATYELLRAQISSTNKKYEAYRTTMGNSSDEERNSAHRAWTDSKEHECELEVMLRKQVAAIAAKAKERSERIVLPEWLREDSGWQGLQKHILNSKFYEPIAGCKLHYDKMR